MTTHVFPLSEKVRDHLEAILLTVMFLLNFLLQSVQKFAIILLGMI